MAQSSNPAYHFTLGLVLEAQVSIGCVSNQDLGTISTATKGKNKK
jgi:hypothetical protein